MPQSDMDLLDSCCCVCFYGKDQIGTFSQLTAAGYQVLNIQVLSPVMRFIKSLDVSFTTPVKPKEVIMFSRQLALLLESGIDIVSALDLFKAQASNRAFQAVLEAIIADLRAGTSFSTALSKFPKIFPAMFYRTIAAGEPIPVPDSDKWTNQATETLEIPQTMVGSKQAFALKVKGRSMIDALIDDGDIVLMEAADTAENGEMVAVWLKDKQEVTLKRIYVETDNVLLKPANPLMNPLKQRSDNVEIQGKVIGVIRKL